MSGGLVGGDGLLIPSTEDEVLNDGGVDEREDGGKRGEGGRRRIRDIILVWYRWLFGSNTRYRG